MGKIVSLKKSAEEGDDVEVHWYRPARDNPTASRSRYGKGGWTEEYLMEDGKRVPSLGVEHVGAVSSVFFELRSNGRLAKHVRAAVAESTLSSGDQQEAGESEEEEEDDDDEEEEELEDAGRDGGRVSAASLLRQPAPITSSEPPVRVSGWEAPAGTA